ncbi:uncharacterized protein LOC141907772 isoform X2 [Tubulanus polymorphus]|uniref:uncharacterized protein LOC141907772 isoform X2 n=1 Tax=Tubulanus polymorphus TaxID=672921 RepID=UPI003DA39391
MAGSVSEGQNDEYFYETKALVLQYLGLVPGALSNLNYEQLDLSASSSVNAVNQSSRSISDDDTSSLRSSVDYREFESRPDEVDGNYPRTSSAKSSPQKPCFRSTVTSPSSPLYLEGQCGKVCDYGEPKQTVMIGDNVRNDATKRRSSEGISIIDSSLSHVNNSSVNESTDSSRFYTPDRQISSSYSESFLSAETTLVDTPTWRSTESLSSNSGRRRRVSREELSSNVQSDGVTRLMRDELSSPQRRRHAASDPVYHTGQPIADRSNLLLNLQPTCAQAQSPDCDMDRGAYLEYLQNEFEEVKRLQTPNSITPIADVLQSPEAEVAKMLDSISAEVMKTYGTSIDEATRRVLKESMVQMTYEDFRNAGDSLLVRAPPGIHRISLALCFSRQIANAMLQRGGQSLRSVTDFSVQFVANTAANFILERGGWLTTLQTFIRGHI